MSAPANPMARPSALPRPNRSPGNRAAPSAVRLVTRVIGASSRSANFVTTKEVPQIRMAMRAPARGRPDARREGMERRDRRGKPGSGRAEAPRGAWARPGRRVAQGSRDGGE